MLEYVINALQNCTQVDRIIVTVSEMTPLTARKASELGANVMLTPGNGFVEDMQYAIRKSNADETLVVCADLPLITPELVDTVIEEFRRNHKPAMTVVAPLEVYEKLGITPTAIIDVGRKVVPVGVNMLDGRRIGEPELDQFIFEVESEALALNVNTEQELRLAMSSRTRPVRST